MIFKTFCVALVISSPAICSLAEQSTGAHSLGDLATLPEARSSWPASFIPVGDLVYFSAVTVGSGRELWVSDKTPSGTRLVKDILPGSVESDFGPMVAYDGFVLFAADDITGPSRLWISDGTEEGTRRVGDGVDGPTLQITEMVVTTHYAYVAADDAAGRAVWRYSSNDDELIKISETEPGSGYGNHRWFKLVADKVVFNTSRGLYAIADGEVQAYPFLSRDGESLTANHMPATRLGKDWYFSAHTLSTGTEVWRTDGTSENTRLLVDLNGGSAHSNPDSMLVYQDELYFVATDEAGKDLFVSDGTAVGTRRVRLVSLAEKSNLKTSLELPETVLQLLAMRYNRHPGVPVTGSLVASQRAPENSHIGIQNPTRPSSWPQDIVTISVSNGTLYIMGQTAVGGYSLWRSDGTYSGTSPLDVISDAGSDLSLIPPFEVAGLDLVIGYTHATGFEFWEIKDGKTVVPMPELYPGFNCGFWGLFLFNDDTIVFAGANEHSGVELWQTQGTAETTVQLVNIEPDVSADSGIWNIVDEEETFAFIGPGKTEQGSAIWRSDGTANGTVPLRSFEEQPWLFGPPWMYGYNIGPRVSSLTRINSGLTFALDFYGKYDSHGQWSVNGDEVEQIGDTPLTSPVPFRNELFARAEGDLWATNGQKGSVRKVAEIAETGYSPMINISLTTDEHVWFFTDTEAAGLAVWRSDGTAAGTMLAADINPDSHEPQFQPLATIGEFYFFLSADTDGVKLWRTGKTDTQLIAQLTQDWDWRIPFYLRTGRLGNKILIVVQPPFPFAGGEQLWVTDGTPGGTQHLGEVLPRRASIFVRNFAVLNDYAYFPGYDDVRGTTLWRTDGTREGTGPAIDVEPGFDRFNIAEPVAHNGAIYFVAQTSGSGKEIWRTDGHESVQVTELMPGSLDADPKRLKSVGHRLIFTAYAPGQGRELHILDE